DQRRPGVFRNEGVGAGIRGDAAAPVRHALPRRRDGTPRHGNRGPPVCHWSAAPDRRPRRGTRLYLLACRRVARHRLGDPAALPGGTTRSAVTVARYTPSAKPTEGRQLQHRPDRVDTKIEL